MIQRAPLLRRAMALCLLLALCLAGPARAAGEESWARLLIDGVQVGYSRDVSKDTFYQGKQAWHVVTDWLLTFKRFGVPVKVTGHSEVIFDEELRPLWVKDVDTAEMLQRSMEGTWDGAAWSIESGMAGKTTHKRWMPPRPAYSLDTIPLLVLRQQPLKSGEYTFPTYEFTKQQVVDTTVKVSLAPLPLRDGTAPYARLDYAVLGQVVSEWIDRQGNTLKASHATFEAYASTRAQAERFEVKEILPIEATSVKLDKALPPIEDIAALQLRVTFPDEQMARAIGDTEFQRVAQREGGVLQIELRKPQLPASPVPALPSPAASLQPFLAADDHIQADDPGIAAQARAVVGKERDPVRKAQKLLAWVHTSVDYTLEMLMTSALATYTSRRSDCKGYAALLTAMARAVGLPAREVFGLTYDPPHQTFAGHAWTEIWLGRWIPFDPTAGRLQGTPYIQLQGLSPTDALYRIRQMRIEVLGVDEQVGTGYLRPVLVVLALLAGEDRAPTATRSGYGHKSRTMQAPH